MADGLQQFAEGTDQNQAVRFYARERRLSHADLAGLNRTHRFVGSGSMAVAAIDTAASFPGATLSRPVTFRSRIEITESVGPGGKPQGMVCEFGDSTRGLAIWVASAGIGFRAGGVSTQKALAIWVPGGTLPIGLKISIVASVDPGTGRIGLFINNRLKKVGVASSGNFGGGWASTAGGSFASAPNDGTPEGVTALSNVAPSGFSVTEPLSVYVGQKVRHFV